MLLDRENGVIKRDGRYDVGTESARAAPFFLPPFPLLFSPPRKPNGSRASSGCGRRVGEGIVEGQEGRHLNTLSSTPLFLFNLRKKITRQK